MGRPRECNAINRRSGVNINGRRPSERTFVSLWEVINHLLTRLGCAGRLFGRNLIRDFGEILNVNVNLFQILLPYRQNNFVCLTV